NVSGKWFDIVSYGVKKDSHLIDYDELEEMAIEEKPKLIIAGGSAYPRIIDFKRFREIADKVGAKLMVDMAHFAGLVAAGIHPSPMEYADVVTSTTHKTLRGPRGGIILTNNEEIYKKINKAVFPGTQGGPLMHIIAAKAVAFKEALHSDFKQYAKQVVNNAKTLGEELKAHGASLVSDGTDTHLILLDLRPWNLTGKEAEKQLEDIGITVNKNTIPYDPEKPFVASGIRMGTPALTTRGMKEKEMIEIARAIANVLKRENDNDVKHAKEIVTKICSRFPLVEE